MRQVEARFVDEGHHVMDAHGRFHEVTSAKNVKEGRRIEKGPGRVEVLPLDQMVTIREDVWTLEEVRDVFGDGLDLR